MLCIIAHYHKKCNGKKKLYVQEYQNAEITQRALAPHIIAGLPVKILPNT
jgi:hypothetical protein